MRPDDDRGRQAAPSDTAHQDDDARQRGGKQPDGHPDHHTEGSGGLRYQQAHRDAQAHQVNDGKPTAGTRSAVARETAAPDHRQDAPDHGGPSADDESWLQDQGYPKLGRKIQSRVTQVEHGPYAGGTQQGDAATRERAQTD